MHRGRYNRGRYTMAMRSKQRTRSINCSCNNGEHKYLAFMEVRARFIEETLFSWGESESRALRVELQSSTMSSKARPSFHRQTKPAIIILISLVEDAACITVHVYSWRQWCIQKFG